MRSTVLAAVAAAALLGWGLPAGVEAGGQKGSTAAGGTSSDPSARGGYSSGGTTSGGTTMTPGAPGSTGGTGTSGTGRTTAGQLSDQDIQDYIEARQQLEQQKPEMKSALESGDLSDRRQELQSALQGSGMSAEEFVRVHRQVQSDPTLRARVEAELGAAGPTGSSGTGASGSTMPATPGTPGGASGGAASPSSPQPGASPQ